jgi:hypothetical protein
MFLSYNGSTQQPSITQISPVADNTNPLILTIGNPFLKQHSFITSALMQTVLKCLASADFFMYGNVSVTNNAIVTNQRTIPAALPLILM